jgi:hypothetical protein
MDIPKLRDSKLDSRNFMLSGCWEFSTLIKAEPIILSLIILLSASITSLPLLNNTLTFLNTIKKVPPIIGTIDMTAKASFQLMRIRRTEIPAITKTEEIMVTKAIETNNFTESISEVRFVKSFEGLDLRTKV